LAGRRLWLPWRAGPASAEQGPVIVSLTDFTSNRQREWPGIYLTGLRLREGWYAMPGAVGLWLWGQPLAGHGGSLSVWQSEADLRRFVALPWHLAIMRHYRTRGSVESATWTMDYFDPTAARLEAERRLA
jgi:hypothetical protein